MKYKIVEKKDFRIVGVARKFSVIDGDQFTKIPLFWGEICKNGLLHKILELAGNGDSYALCADFSLSEQSFTYIIAAKSNATELPEGFISRTIPAATWAVFEAIGPLPTQLQSIIQQANADFFTMEPFIHGNAPEIEFYPDGNTSSPDYRCEYWIPVIAK
jgi:AraC family transcriptional regulator